MTQIRQYKQEIQRPDIDDLIYGDDHPVSEK